MHIYTMVQTIKEMVEGDRETSMTQLSRAFNAGSYVVGPIEVTVTDGKLTVGVKGTRNDTWCIWDNFQLKYLGALTDLTPYVEALAAAVAAAEDPVKMAEAFRLAVRAAELAREANPPVATFAANATSPMDIFK